MFHKYLSKNLHTSKKECSFFLFICYLVEIRDTFCLWDEKSRKLPYSEQNKSLISVIISWLLRWQVLPDQLTAVIWSLWKPTLPNTYKNFVCSELYPDTGIETRSRPFVDYFFIFVSGPTALLKRVNILFVCATFTYSRPYVYSFWKVFQTLRFFPESRVRSFCQPFKVEVCYNEHGDISLLHSFAKKGSHFTQTQNNIPRYTGQFLSEFDFNFFYLFLNTLHVD